MGRFLKNAGRNFRLAFKTVTFHWKQYFCFIIAILSMEVMFGIIVMSSSKNIDEYTAEVERYSWHFAMTNLSEGQRKTAISIIDKETITPYSYINSSETGAGILYISIDQYYLGNDVKPVSLETLYERFATKYAPQISGIKYSDINYKFSPRYELQDKLFGMRIECAVKLLVLALVSIAVIILLLNIRLNHFKFTYGIYMSYGADTKKLFSTSFWDMIVIGILTLIPAAALSFFGTYILYNGMLFSGGLIAEFLKSYLWLFAFALLFLIPVCVVAVYIPIKLIASKPPLKLLIAQDNSNLVSSPRISVRLFGKKFPRAYESLGLFRFRKYVATVTASSVLFASIFVWISFYSTIYDFNTGQDQAEFTVNVNCEMETVSGYVQTEKMSDKTSDYQKLKKTIYKEVYTASEAAALEKYYTAAYTITRAENGKITHVYDSAGNELYGEYWTARNNVVREGYQDKSAGNSSKFTEYEEYITDGNYADGTNNPNVEYAQERDASGYVTKVYKKKSSKTYQYPTDLIQNMKKKESALETLITENQDYSFTLLKNIDFSLYKTENADDSNATIKSNYVYIGFDRSNVKAFSGIKYNTRVNKKITDNVQFYPLDESGYNLNFLNKYEMEIMNGDDVLTLNDLKSKDGTKYIIISETAANSQVLNIKPGDTVDISYTSQINGDYDETLRGDELLSELIKQGEFEEVETYTVYAVIKNMPTSEDIPIYLLEDDFERITGVENISNSFSIYMPTNSTYSQIISVYENLVNWSDGYAEIIWHNAISENREKIEMNNLPVIELMATFSLILSPLFWFFSQIMFYGKREEEFRMLRGLGATEKEIKKIFRKDARVFGFIGMAATVIMSLLGIFVIHKLNMTYVAFFSTDALNLYRFEMPWINFAIAVAVTGICAYLSSMISYRIDRKKARKTITREFGDD